MPEMPAPTMRTSKSTVPPFGVPALLDIISGCCSCIGNKKKLAKMLHRHYFEASVSGTTGQNLYWVMTLRRRRSILGEWLPLRVRKEGYKLNTGLLTDRDNGSLGRSDLGGFIFSPSYWRSNDANVVIVKDPVRGCTIPRTLALGCGCLLPTSAMPPRWVAADNATRQAVVSRHTDFSLYNSLHVVLTRNTEFALKIIYHYILVYRE